MALRLLEAVLPCTPASSSSCSVAPAIGNGKRQGRAEGAVLLPSLCHYVRQQLCWKQHRSLARHKVRAAATILTLAAAGSLLRPAAAATNDAGQDLSRLVPVPIAENVGLTGCELPARSGKFSGVCERDLAKLESHLDFCAGVVQYGACIPSLSAAWPDWNITAKDRLLAQLYKELTEERMAKEANVTPHEYVEIHLLSNAECMTTLRNVLCWYNFPKCDDDNVSLPLCRKSCDRYFAACDFPQNRTDRRSDYCRPTSYERHGIFGVGFTSPAQVLSDSDKECGSAASLSAAYQDPPVTPWYLTWWGLILIIVGGSSVIWVVYSLLTPFSAQDYIAWFLWRTITCPYRTWTRMPIFKGRTVLFWLWLVVMALLGTGTYRRFFGGDRFKSAEDVGVDMATPAPDSGHMNVIDPLSNAQLRQLVSGCGCTGTAAPGSRVVPVLASLLVGAVATHNLR